MQTTLALFGFMVLSLGGMSVSASDWLTSPSTYTHDPVTGIRVSQFTPVQGPASPVATNFRTSGYTHTRSSLNYGQSADNYHRVKRWGDTVRPYGEWRFPNRPYSTPYSNWGAPYAGLNLGFGGLGGIGGHYPGTPFGGYPANPSLMNPYHLGPNSAHRDAPYFDGHHPVYRD